MNMKFHSLNYSEEAEKKTAAATHSQNKEWIFVRETHDTVSDMFIIILFALTYVNYTY